jgi:hypothetical protein
LALARQGQANCPKVTGLATANADRRAMTCGKRRLPLNRAGPVSVWGFIIHRYLRLVPLLFAAVMLTWGGVTPAFSAGKIGVVLMHGKTGTAKPKSFIGPLVAKLKEADILVEATDMPWSRSRYLAKDYEESMAEIVRGRPPEKARRDQDRRRRP